MKRINKNQLKYGGMSVFLTVLVLVAVVILNVIVAALAGRYDWMYRDMTKSAVYSISDNCRSYLEEYVMPHLDGEEKINVIFCNNRESIESDLSQKYIHDSFYEIQAMFPSRIDIEYLNIWEEPKLAREYGVTSSTDVICIANDRHETMNLEDFYVFEVTNNTSPIAYNGEKIIASCMMRVTQETTPKCYLTANHGESFGDYELIRAMVEAGYSCAFLDLSSSDIPEDCEILVTYNPKQDFIISDGFSEISEIDKLDAFMANGGKYMFFASADTFVSGGHKNLEEFLSSWGVNYMHKKGSEGVEECYLIKDSSNSITVDGYMVVAEYSGEGIGKEMLKDLSYPNVFGNSCAISFSEGFLSDGKSNYVNKETLRTVSPLLLSHKSAEAWAGGRAVARAAEEPFVLMSVSTAECENGKQAYLIASASTEFVNEDNMQSSVLGNSRTVARILQSMGKENVPSDLVFKPFESTEIESITTSTANTLTVVLTVIPALVFTVWGAVVLIRRKNL